MGESTHRGTFRLRIYIPKRQLPTGFWEQSSESTVRLDFIRGL